MLIGKCPECDAIYSGWALKSPWYQLCDRCWVEIDIKDSQAEIFSDHSTYKPDQNIGEISISLQ